MVDPEDRSILIVGSGAMACLFAARLSAVGLNITLFGRWEAGLKALGQKGVRLVTAEGSERAYPVRVISTTTECSKKRFALVLVKSWQTEDAAHSLAQCLTADGVALSLQNGLGNQEVLSKVLGAHRVALGVTTAGATLLEPGRVRPSGTGGISIAAGPNLLSLIEWLEKQASKSTSPQIRILWYGTN